MTTRTCAIGGCGKSVTARGWCVAHYYRWYRHGTPAGKPAPEPKVCSVPGCGRAPRGRGYCGPHYKRWVRWGDPNIKRPTTDANERFWAKVDKDGPTPLTFRDRGQCWQWTAGVIGTGYGLFHPTKATHSLAHRYSYELLVGTIPAGLVIDHLCRNRRCVNPAHLEPVTSAVNTRRGLGISTFNALKTSCPAGHPYSAENTYRSPRGGRRCRACARERDRQPHRNAATRRRAAREHNNQEVA